MSSKTVDVIFEPEGRQVRVPPGTPLLAAASAAGIAIETPCGGYGVCGKCKVEFTQGQTDPDPDEVRLLTPAERAQGVRLACRQRVYHDSVVTIPDASRSRVQQILLRGEQRQAKLRPAVRKVYMTVPRPSLNDQRGDWERLETALRQAAGETFTATDRIVLDYSVARDLPSTLRRADFSVTAVLSGESPLYRLIALESGDTTEHLLGLAFDVGTTTVVGYLLDLHTGSEIAVASAMNAQIAYGDDVVSRIKHAREQAAGREHLQQAIRQVVSDLVYECAHHAGVPETQIYDATVVGNTCMAHLFLGLDPTYLGELPYVPAVQRSYTLTARELGLPLCPGASVYFLPSIAGFVGADTVGVLLAHLWDVGEGTRVAIDIGTNGEIVLAHGNRLWGCSAAAGPAFEGARISCGMRGSPGAVSQVRLNERVYITTIHNQPPRGLCGSGLVDAVAGLLDAGIVDSRGRLVHPDEVPHLPPELRARVAANGDADRQFILVPAEESATGQSLSLTQRDIRELQLAKGSLAAALRTLLRIAGVNLEDVETLYLAGGFGNYLNPSSAQRIGLLPPEIPLERIEGVGNAAGVGAKLALLSLEERHRAEEIAQRVEHVELATNLDYQMTFMETMLFPT